MWKKIQKVDYEDMWNYEYDDCFTHSFVLLHLFFICLLCRTLTAGLSLVQTGAVVATMKAAVT